MTHEQLTKLTESLCDNLKAAILEAVPYMPDTWDGLELREFMADLARERFTVMRREKLTGLLRAYRKARATTSGL